MATVTKAKLKLNNQFADDSTAAIEYPNVDSTLDIETLRANIKAVDAAAISDTYIAESGAAFTNVKTATYTVTEDEEINLNG